MDDERSPLRRRVRRAAVAVLLVVGISATTASVLGWWVRHDLADTDVWVERVGPLPADPAVRAALSDWLGDRVIERVDPTARFAEALPERGRILAVPLAGAVEGFVRDRVDAFVASDRFARLWVASTERAHRAALRVLRGESDVVVARDDVVVIDLDAALVSVLAEIADAAPDLLGRDVDVEALGDRIDVPVRFVVYDRGRLTAVQDAIEQARRWLLVLTVTAPAALGTALHLSDRRRRTLLQALAGLAVGLALTRRAVLRAQGEVLAGIPDRLARDAAAVVTDRFVEPFLDLTAGLLLVVAGAAVVALVTGPHPWAVRLRGAVPGAAGQVHRRVSAEPDAARLVGVALVVLVLLVADLSFGQLVVVGLTGAGVVALRGRRQAG